MKNTSLLVLYFNSIKVRLERNDAMNQIAYFLFQFHKGAIRTAFLFHLCKVDNQFQFHKGAIRTSISQQHHICYYLFQFHKGAIRTIQFLV